VISYLCSMARLNMMEEEFRAQRMEECKCATYFAMRHEMDRSASIFCQVAYCLSYRGRRGLV
jgi:hypothetical protein